MRLSLLISLSLNTEALNWKHESQDATRSQAAKHDHLWKDSRCSLQIWGKIRGITKGTQIFWIFWIVMYSTPKPSNAHLPSSLYVSRHRLKRSQKCTYLPGFNGLTMTYQDYYRRHIKATIHAGIFLWKGFCRIRLSQRLCSTCQNILKEEMVYSPGEWRRHSLYNQVSDFQRVWAIKWEGKKEVHRRNLWKLTFSVFCRLVLFGRHS